jgi:hypothetical protein
LLFAGLLLIPGLLAAALYTPVGGRVVALARAGALLGLLGGPLFVLVGYFLQSVYFSPPDRYFFSVLPLTAICVGAVARRPTAVVTLGTVVGFGLLLTVVRLVGG